METQKKDPNITHLFMSLDGSIRKTAILKILKRKKLKKINGRKNTIRITDKDISKKISEIIDKEYIEKLFENTRHIDSKKQV